MHIRNKYFEPFSQWETHSTYRQSCSRNTKRVPWTSLGSKSNLWQVYDNYYRQLRCI